MSPEKRTRQLMRKIPKREQKEAAKLILESIEETHLEKLYAIMNADPEGWAAMYHFGGGRDIRNLLRFCGYTDKWSSLPRRRGYRETMDIVLDHIWAPLVELAMQGYDPAPSVRRRIARQKAAERRWRERCRAYVEACKTEPKTGDSTDGVSFSYERVSLDPEVVAALNAMAAI